MHCELFYWRRCLWRADLGITNVQSSQQSCTSIMKGAAHHLLKNLWFLKKFSRYNFHHSNQKTQIEIPKLKYNWDATMWFKTQKSNAEIKRHSHSSRYEKEVSTSIGSLRVLQWGLDISGDRSRDNHDLNYSWSSSWLYLNSLGWWTFLHFIAHSPLD